MAYQITGKIEVIGAITPVTSKDGKNTFNKRELVLDCTRFNPDTGEPWENHPRFEFGGQNCTILDQFQVGQRVTVDFNLKGTKYVDEKTNETKYFTAISAFRVVLAPMPQYQQDQAPAPIPQFQVPQAPPQQPYYPQQPVQPMQPQYQVPQYQQPGYQPQYPPQPQDNQPLPF